MHNMSSTHNPKCIYKHLACKHNRQAAQTDKHASKQNSRQTSRQSDRHSDANTNRAFIQTSKHTDKQLGQATTNTDMTTQDGTRLEKTGGCTDKQQYPKPDWQADIKNRQTNKPPCIDACTHKTLGRETTI